jgi:NitT/TauT family transport system substrate-binding protein
MISRVKTASLLLALVSLLTAACRSSDQNGPAANDARLVVQFGWLFDAHHLGFLLAEKRGFYDQEGLDVTLLPGGLDSSPVRAVATGAADIGQLSGAEQLLSAAQEGLPIVAIAAFHRHSPHAIISLSSNPITSPDSLVGKTVAVAYGDAAEFLFRSFLRQNKIQESQVHLVPFRFDLTPLRRKQVDAITGFLTDQPLTLKAAGLNPVVLSYSDFGVSEYGYMFATTRDQTTRNSKSLRAFLRASRKGWQEVFADPDGALGVLGSAVKGLDMNVERAKLLAVRRLMLENGQVSDWKVDKAVIMKTERRMVAFGALKKKVDVSGLIDNKFLEIPN